jgi:Ser/Thr protein kinase RdoA (MazF antagonist)
MNWVLAAFGLDPARVDVQPFGNGHINKTYRISVRDAQISQQFVLQQINTRVFKQPQVIARNHMLTGRFLAQSAPEYLFLHPIATADGSTMVHDDAGSWRLLPYIPNTITVDKAESPRQAYEAARQFGRFARMTAEIDLSAFEPAIPDFHNLTLRAAQLQAALASASDDRRTQAAAMTEAYASRLDVVADFVRLQQALPDRLMHHDTKINNALLRAGSYEGVCVCDLDTVMPGKIISDLGDMVRTYVSPVSEDEPDDTRVTVRDEYYAALMDGYLSEMGGLLTPTERAHIAFAGEFLAYMQGVRFLADFLNGDVYYPVKHNRHNLDRARNQWALLVRLTEKRAVLQGIIDACLNANPNAEAIARR